MRRTLGTILACALAISASAIATRAEAAEVFVVTTTWGTTYQGELVELVPGDHITIHLATGEVRLFRWGDISQYDDTSTPEKPVTVTTPPVVDPPPAVVQTTPAIPLDAYSGTPKVDHDVSAAGSAAGFDIRTTFIGVTFTKPSTALTLFGMDLGYGFAVSDRLVVGPYVSGNLSLALSAGGAFFTARYGLDVRYDLGDKSGMSASWLGLRGGLERVAGLSPKGGYFGEVTLGIDFLRKPLSIGMQASAGLSIEGKNVYSDAMSEIDKLPPSDTIYNPYLTGGLRFGW